MSDEYSKPPYKKKTGIPEGYGWNDMSMLKGAELEGMTKNVNTLSVRKRTICLLTV